MKKNIIYCFCFIMSLALTVNASDQVTTLTHNQGSLEITSHFDAAKTDGLCLIIQYKNNSKQAVYLRKMEDTARKFLVVRVVLDSNLTGSEAPKDWTGAKDQGDSVELQKASAYKTTYEKILPGETAEQIHYIEKAYPVISDVIKKSPVYVMWSKDVKLCEAVAGDGTGSRHGSELVYTRIGGFFAYPIAKQK